MRFQGDIIHFYGTPKPDALKILIEDLKIERTSESSHKAAPFNTWGKTPNGRIFFVLPPHQIRLKKRGKWSRWSTFYRTLIQYPQHPFYGDMIITSILASDKKRLKVTSKKDVTDTDITMTGILLREVHGVPICYTWDHDEFERRVQGKESFEVRVKK